MPLDILGLLSFESALLQNDDGVVSRSVFDVFIPVVLESAGDAVDLLVLGGELSEVVGNFEKDNLVQRIQGIGDDIVLMLVAESVVIIIDLPAIEPYACAWVIFFVFGGAFVYISQVIAVHPVKKQ